MARIYMAGAEIEPYSTLGPDGVISGTGTVPTRETTVFRSGLASWKFDSTSSNVTAYITSASSLAFVDGRTYYLRIYIRAAAAPTTAAQIVQFGSPGNAAVRFRTDGGLELQIGSVAQGGSSVSIVDSNWHRIELSLTSTATSTWTAAELRLDGASVATWSGSQARSLSWGFGWVTAPGASTVINFDDVAVNDSTGTVNNTWCGNGAVVLLRPTADSAVGAGWTLGTGTAISGNTGQTAVANTPPLGVADLTAGSDTKQIRNAASNANVNYDATMTTYTAAGIGAADTINAVRFFVLTAAPVATSAKLGTYGIVSNPTVANVALDVGAGTAGAFWDGLAAGAYNSPASWKWSYGAIQDAPAVTKGTAPVMRITQVTASTRVAMVAGMFIYADYTPAAPVARSLAVPGSRSSRAGALPQRILR